MRGPHFCSMNITEDGKKYGGSKWGSVPSIQVTHRLGLFEILGSDPF
jgi:hypothetical protein